MTATTRSGFPLETIALEADPTTLTGYIVEGETVPLAELGEFTPGKAMPVPWEWRPDVRRACRERYGITNEQWAEMSHQVRSDKLAMYRTYCETVNRKAALKKGSTVQPAGAGGPRAR